MADLTRATELAIEDARALCALAGLDRDGHDLRLDALPDAVEAFAQLHRERGESEPRLFSAALYMVKDEAARLRMRSQFTPAELEDLQLAIYQSMERIHRRRCAA